MGDKHSGDIFSEEYDARGAINAGSFESFLSVVDTYTHAQLNASTGVSDFEIVKKSLHLEALCDELPEHAERLRQRFDAARERVRELPFVLSHGDFNPHNLYPGGVIDFEDSFYAPFGYDLVSAITHINYFPESKEYEYSAGYHFTQEQKDGYLKRLDDISTSAGLPPITKFAEDFEFLRAIWLGVKNGSHPMLQRFRYNLLAERFIN